MTAEPSTPPPVYGGPRPPDRPPPRMEFPHKAEYRSAAAHVTRLYPGPVGELLRRELLVVDEFGWIVGPDSLIHRAMLQINEEWRKREEATP